MAWPRLDRDQPAAARAMSTWAMRILRRIAGAAALIAGALLMWLSPDVLAGALIMAAGIALETVGIALERM